MNDYRDFSSWGPDKESQFVPFERVQRESSKKAFTMGMVAGIGFGVLILLIYVGVTPDKPNTEAEPDTIGAERPSAPAAAPAPTPPPAEVPVEAAQPAATPPAEPAAAAPVAPPPPPGATKAPPTALVPKK